MNFEDMYFIQLNVLRLLVTALLGRRIAGTGICNWIF